MQLFTNDTISASGSAPFTAFESSDIVLIINITIAPTGTTPSLQFTVSEVDPIDQMTIVGGQVESDPITDVGTAVLRLTDCVSDTVLISWALSGTSSPQFTGVNVTIIEKHSGSSVTPIAQQAKTVYDLSDSSVIYIGIANVSTPTSTPAWLIKKVIIDGSGNPTSTLWSKGTAIWDNHLSETYQ